MEQKEKTTQPIDELISQRLKKLEGLESSGIEAFPAGVWKPGSNTQQIKKEFENTLEKGAEDSSKVFRLAGRITLRRSMGKASFIDLTDSTGKLQVYLKQDKLGRDKYKVLTDFIDIGDIVGVEGNVFKTRTGELSIFASDLVLLSKSLRPLPEKWHGLTDPEARYRQRYLDLISNSEIKEVFVKRNKVIESIRATLKKDGYLEVETPMLHPIAGGAIARPFITHHNALDADLFMRIAPELYLKRLLVGGFEKVFEIGKSFRNEGLDRKHNPEFTMVEIYCAYADYQDMMDLCQKIIQECSAMLNPNGEYVFEGKKFNLKQDFKRKKYFEALKEETGIDFEKAISDGTMKEKAKELSKIDISDKLPEHKILDAVFDEYAVASLTEPTFVYDYPSVYSPLARVKKDNPVIAERFELFIAGQELANAYSELNNPLIQSDKFKFQQKQKESGNDSEASTYDADYIVALEHGMPPAGGLGIGIDRFVMLLTVFASIREVVLFPTLRPEKI